MYKAPFSFTSLPILDTNRGATIFSTSNKSAFSERIKSEFSSLFEMNNDPKIKVIKISSIDKVKSI
jgi:hypothetical protein